MRAKCRGCGTGCGEREQLVGMSNWSICPACFDEKSAIVPLCFSFSFPSVSPLFLSRLTKDGQRRRCVRYVVGVERDAGPAGWNLKLVDFPFPSVSPLFLSRLTTMHSVG